MYPYWVFVGMNVRACLRARTCVWVCVCLCVCQCVSKGYNENHAFKNDPVFVFAFVL